MSGSIFDELKKNDLTKKKDKLKFVTALISTNLLVAVATYSLFAENQGQAATKIVKRSLHPHHKMIIAPLTLLVENVDNVAEMPVTLMNRNKKILVRKAYLHEEIRAKNAEGMGVTRFKIEIPEEDVLKLSADEGTPVLAIPELKIELSKKAVNKRVSKYEINL